MVMLSTSRRTGRWRNRGRTYSEFTVNAASTASSVPSTGELHSPVMYIGIVMIFAAVCSTSVLAIRKKRSN